MIGAGCALRGKRPAEEGPSNLGRRPTATWEEVASPKRWPVSLRTALISSINFRVNAALARDRLILSQRSIVWGWSAMHECHREASLASHR